MPRQDIVLSFGHWPPWWCVFLFGPSSQIQIIQSLDGGILQEIYVQEGGIVTKGQPLARIDDTRFRSDFDQQEQEVFGLQTNIIRMRTELDSIIISDMSSDWRQQVKITKQNLVFPQTIIDEEPELVKRQQEEYSIRLDNLSNQLEILVRQIQQRQQEIVKALFLKLNCSNLSVR